MTKHIYRLSISRTLGKTLKKRVRAKRFLDKRSTEITLHVVLLHTRETLSANSVVFTEDFHVVRAYVNNGDLATWKTRLRYDSREKTTVLCVCNVNMLKTYSHGFYVERKSPKVMQLFKVNSIRNIAFQRVRRKRSSFRGRRKNNGLANFRPGGSAKLAKAKSSISRANDMKWKVSRATYSAQKQKSHN